MPEQGAFETARRLVDRASGHSSSVVTNSGLAPVAASFLAIAEAINNLAEAVKEG